MITWPAFLAAAAVLAVIPGANQLLGLRHALLHGARSAMAGVAGRFAAFLVLIGLVTSGLSVLLLRSAVAFEVLRWVGVVYLVLLGLHTFRQAGGRASVGDTGPQDVRRAARREFVTALTNPKALLLFAAVLPQFVQRDAAWPTVCLVGLVYVLVEAVAAAGYIGVGLLLRRCRRSPQVPYARRVDQGSGLALLGFGGWLAISGRP